MESESHDVAHTQNILNNSGRRWKIVQRMASIGFYDWYPQEDKIIWDEALHRIQGLRINSKQKRQEYFMSTIHPEDVQSISSDMGKILDPTHPADEFEHNFRSIVNGKLKYIRTAGFREIDDSGLVARVYGIVMDTTSEVQTVQKIRKNEERLRIAANATGFGMFDFNTVENNVYWDPQLREIFGLTERSEIDLNDHFFTHIHPDDIDRVSSHYAERMSPEGTNNTAMEEFRIVINEKVKFIASYGKIIRDSAGNVLRVTGTMQDLTALKKNEQELRESKEYFRSVFEGSTDHIFTINLQREIVFINNVAPGLTREQVIGTPLLDLVTPKDRKMVDRVLDKVIQKKVTQQYNTSFEGPKGTLFYTTRVSPLIENGKVFGATFISRDTTKEKGVEKKLKVQARELKRTNKNLEQFAYISSHDIKAPITNLEILLNMMEDQHLLKKEGEDIFNRAKTSVNQISKTLKAVNEVFAVQSNLHLPKKEINLETVLVDVLSSIDSIIDTTHTKINFDFEDAPSVNFPEIHLRSIYQNLITNSIKYCKEGVNSEINITSEKIKRSKKVILTVTDNGTGLDMDKYGGKVFELFQRFHLDTDGKGMGLYLIKLIVENYGGKITMESEAGVGTTFTIMI